MTKDSYHHKNLKQALVAEAVRRLDADPTTEISLRGLARDLGVSPTAPYAHFRSKAELLSAVALNGSLSFRKDLMEVTTADLDFTDRLVAYCERYLAFSQNHPGQFQQMFATDLRAEDDPSRLASRENAEIVRKSMGKDMSSADDASLRIMLDLLHTFIFGVAVQAPNNLLSSLYNGDLDTADLVRLGVEALTMKFREMNDL